MSLPLCPQVFGLSPGPLSLSKLHKSLLLGDQLNSDGAISSFLFSFKLFSKSHRSFQTYLRQWMLLFFSANIYSNVMECASKKADLNPKQIQNIFGLFATLSKD